MRAVLGCAVVMVLACAGGSAEGRMPLPKLGVPSCEEQCREEGVRDDATCDDAPMQAQSRVLCHDNVKARVDVCLRICED
jgi:hypothetical protein